VLLQALLFYEPNGALSDSEPEEESELHHPTCSASSGGADTSMGPACVDTATSAAADAAPAAQQGQGPVHSAAVAGLVDPSCADRLPPVAAAIFGSVANEHKPRSPKRMRS
jgi:hypothetical protein